MEETFRIEPLSSDHDRSLFSSGSESLDRYFREQASQDMKRRIATCFVAVSTGGNEVAGFYSLAATSIALSSLAPDIIKKLPRYPVVPAALLGRLAIARSHQGKGLGELLLVDTLTRAQRIYTEAGGIGLFVDALDEKAAGYYRRFGFEASPGNSLLLFLSAKVIG